MSLILTSFSWFGLGVGDLADNKDFGLVTVLRGGVPEQKLISPINKRETTNLKI